jgi:uncharacterized protein with beta-barrel porin domain
VLNILVGPLGGLVRRIALLASLALVAAPALAVGQTIVPAGPGVETGPYYVMNGADLPSPGQSTSVPPNFATQSGAIQALAFDPANLNILLAASPNGGIFRSTDGGHSWAATTDNQASLSIASLSFDPTDLTGRTVVAGVGLVSSGATFGLNPYFNRSRGGVLDGLMVSNDAGATWTNVTATLPAIGFEAVAIRGSTILAAAFNEEGSWAFGAGVEAGSGLYRSTDGGHSFSQVTTGLPAGAASALVGDPSNPNRFYVAITTASAGNANDAGTSVYTTTDGGQTWSKVFDASNASGTINSSDPTALRLAAGPNGSVAIAVVDGPSGTVVGVFLSKDGGGTWHDLSVALTPGVAAGTGSVVRAGDGTHIAVSGSAFTHVVADEGVPDQAVNPGGQASIHSVISIDPNNPNTVYVAGDRQDLPSDTGAVTYSGNALRATLNNDGSVTYSAITDDFTGDHSTYHPDSRAMTFDANGNLVVGSDGGVYTRSNPQSDSGVWRGLNFGRQALEIYGLGLDPHSGLIAVAAQDNGSAIQSPTNRSTYRVVEGGDGTVAVINGVTDPNSSWTYVACQYFCGGPTRFQTDIHGGFTAANPVDIYYSVDGTAGGIIGLDSSDVLFVPKLKLNNIDPTYMALGVQPGIILAQDDVLATPLDYASTPLFGYSGPGSYTILPLNFAGYTGFNQALDFGTRDNEFALLAGGSSYGGHRLFVSTAPDYADVWLSPVLSYHGFAPTAVLFDPRSQNRFFATDTNILYGTVDGGATGGNLAANLPAHFIRPQSLAFVSTNGVNALLVGGLNDAANVGSPLVSADSDANGVLTNWRRLGTGLPNADVTVLDYQPTLDALAIGTFGRGAFLLYDVTSNYASATVLQFGLANNDSNPATSLLSGARPLIKYGTGTLTLNGAATYTGGSDFKAGNVVLNGSILNGALVEAPATLYGGGSIGGQLRVNGTVAPGGVTGLTLSVGSLVAGPGSVLKIAYGAGASTALAASGSANITGMTLQLAPQAGAGTSFYQKYLILSSTGLTGVFTNAAGFHADGALQERLRYDLVPNDVFLDVVHPIDWTQGATNPNQKAVGAALNATQLTGTDAWLNALNGVFNGGTGFAANLGALSGEGGVNTQQSARLVGDQFLSIVSGHIGGDSNDGGGLRLAENNLRAPNAMSLTMSDVANSAVASAARSSAPRSSGVWGEAFGVSDRLTGEFSPVKSTATGFAAGWDHDLGRDANAGFAIGYAQATADTVALATKTKGDYLNVSVYASRRFGPWMIGAIGGYNSGHANETRTIALIGGPTLTATGSPTEIDVKATVMAGRAFSLSPATRLTATGSFTYNDASQKSFTETGAGVFSLHYRETRRTSYLTEAGLRIDHTIKTQRGPITPYAGVSEVIQGGDRAVNSTVAFTGAPNASFVTQGDRLPTNWTNAKLGLRFSPSNGLKFDVHYQGAFGAHLKEDAAMASVSFRF